MRSLYFEQAAINVYNRYNTDTGIGKSTQFWSALASNGLKIGLITLIKFAFMLRRRATFLATSWFAWALQSLRA
jgi:hypothetical protein